MPHPTEPYVTPYTVIIDSREQAPFRFDNFKADARHHFRPLAVSRTVKALTTGDYSIEGHESYGITIERKSKSDAWSTFTTDRERFEKELERMQSFDYAAVVIECSLPDLVSARCPHCMGTGRICRSADDDVYIEFKVKEFGNLVDRRVYELIRMKGQALDWEKCPKCNNGEIQPVEYTRWNPKSIFRSILAWQVRYGVHFHLCDSRRYAETITLRLLERFWLDEQEKKKARG